MYNYFFRVVSMLALMLCPALSVAANQIAFPGAEGYGKYTVGGRGGKIYKVTNLNDSGPGSMREAIEAAGPRTVVFDVSGTIALERPLTIANPYITIAGQTAPGDGICVRNQQLTIRADHVIIRYIRVRLGDQGARGVDAVESRYTKNLMLDHVSASWGGDEVLTVYHGEYVTVQNCVVSEAMGDGKGHKFGAIWGSNYSTYHRNLIANNDSRNPRWASGCGYADYRNNVLYNWGYNSSYGGEAHQRGDRRNPPIEFSHINMVANYYKPGPATQPGVRARIVNPWTRGGAGDAGKWWVAENFVEGSPEVTADNWKGVSPSSPEFRLGEAWSSMPIKQQTAEEAYKSVLERVGCSLVRDAVDRRIIEEVRTGAATYGKGIISSQRDVGGWPELKSLPASKDSDGDGMPDWWEAKYGLNPNDASDANGDLNGTGFTNLEEYLNGTNPTVFVDYSKPVNNVNKLTAAAFQAPKR